MNRILIVPSHPNDFEEQDIREFISLIEAKLPKGVEVDYSPAEFMRKGMYGVSFWQSLKVFLEDIPADVRSAVVSLLITEGALFLRRVLRKRTNNIRPNTVIIYDESKKEIASTIMSNSRQKPRNKEEFEKWQKEKINRTQKRKKKTKKNKK